MAYDERAAEFLSKGAPHPAVAPGNRGPTLRELKSVDCAGVTFDVRNSAEGDAVLETFSGMRGETYEAELRVVYALAQIRGYKWIHPDSGAPSIIVDLQFAFARAVRVWKEANHREDGWAWLYRELYG